MPVIIEIKAKCTRQEEIRNFLTSQKAIFKGTDHQVDTYYKVGEGRLKLREGNIENNLIYYKRPDALGPKKSEVILYPVSNSIQLKTILSESLGVLVVVDKLREIYFIENVKFHIDNVIGLGSFIEIEAIDDTGTLTDEFLWSQCQRYMTKFQIGEKDLISGSYSDLLLKLSEPL